MSNAAHHLAAHQLRSPPAPPLIEARPLEGIQPGGGVGVDLEAAWGRLRRAWLRALRPGYVRQMASRRQGQCPACPHDIIDGRDLKLVRNVCGFSFAPRDDRFAWRERLPLARAGLAEVVLSSLVCAPLLAALLWLAFGTGALAAWLGVALVAVLWFQMVWFFRDPHRTPPADPEALVSPSDGVVTHLDEVDAPDFPGERAFRISIYLSPFDVHLNRNPRDGQVVQVRYFRGKFLNARHRDCVARNEQLWTDLVEPSGRRIRVKQISGALARRLVCWLRAGEQVRRGERFGLIKFGSRSEVLLPVGDAGKLEVEIGTRVRAGETVLVRFGGPR